jgi:hypothetical protein
LFATELPPSFSLKGDKRASRAEQLKPLPANLPMLPCYEVQIHEA